MNRLTRIALTLFASATILVFLAKARLAKVQSLDSNLAGELIRSETQMAKLALGIAAALAIAGLALLVRRIQQRRRSGS